MTEPRGDPAPAMLPRGLARLVGEAAKEAGALALRWFRAGERTGARIWTKDADSPVTEADIEVDHFLRERLTTAFPDFGWLSEETADSDERLSRRRVFVVDPIDGTRAFLRGDPRWCVSIAVVADGAPVVAVVHAPALATTHAAVAGGAATLNGAPLRMRWLGLGGGARLAGPRQMLEAMASFNRAVTLIPKIPSLALRLCGVADGSLDLALASGGSHDWDIAAAHLIVERAGGTLADLEGAVPRYNGPRTTHGRLLTAPREGLGEALGQVRRALGLPELAAGASWQA
jgi:myo-inositol-1(or 4)-monophosphatase